MATKPLSDRLFSNMTITMEVCGDREENRRRFRLAYEDAERLMFGAPESPRDYLAFPRIEALSEEALGPPDHASL